MIKAFIVVNNHGTSPCLNDARIFHLSTPRQLRCHRVSASSPRTRPVQLSWLTISFNPPFPAAMVRLCRFYEQLGVDKQTELCQTVYKIVTGRPDHLCSFVDDEKTFGPDTKLVYRHFATLYFCILSDRSESNLRCWTSFRSTWRLSIACLRTCASWTSFSTHPRLHRARRDHRRRACTRDQQSKDLGRVR